MVKVSIIRPGEGEAITLGPAVQMHILEDGRTTQHRIGMAESTIAPHTAGPPQHRHARHEEGFYVVSGTLRFTIGDQDHDAGPGTLVMVPTAPRTPSPTPAPSPRSCSPSSPRTSTCSTSATCATSPPPALRQVAPSAS